jgi:hypothetical protein
VRVLLRSMPTATRGVRFMVIPERPMITYITFKCLALVKIKHYLFSYSISTCTCNLLRFYLSLSVALHSTMLWLCEIHAGGTQYCVKFLNNSSFYTNLYCFMFLFLFGFAMYYIEKYINDVEEF